MNIFTNDFLFIYLNLIIFFLFFTKYNVIAKVLNLYDLPNKRKIHSKKTPLVGGIGIFTIITVYFFFNIISNQNDFNFFEMTGKKNLAIYFFFLSFFFVSLYDDRYRLKNYIKLVFYIVIINFFLDLFPEFRVNSLSFEILDDSLNLQSLAKLFTIACIITFLTASNMYDGINLNFSIFSISVFLIFYILSGFLLFLVLILFLGFFSIFNYSGKIFLGETGCILIAFLIAIYSIYFYHQGQYQAEKIYLLMLLPINDNLRVVIVRLLNGRNAFYPDKSHFHHLLYLKYGFNKFALFQISFAILTIIFFISNFTIIGIIVLNLIYLSAIFFSRIKK